jgi:hypothetical protein
MSDTEPREAAAADSATAARRDLASVSPVASSWRVSVTLSLAFSAAC